MEETRQIEDILADMELLTLYGDEEIAHTKADDLLCEALQWLADFTEKGEVAEKIVEAFHNVDKWYA